MKRVSGLVVSLWPGGTEVRKRKTGKDEELGGIIWSGTRGKLSSLNVPTFCRVWTMVL